MPHSDRGVCFTGCHCSSLFAATGSVFLSIAVYRLLFNTKTMYYCCCCYYYYYYYYYYCYSYYSY